MVLHPRLRQGQRLGVVDVVDQRHGHAVDDRQALVGGGQQQPDAGRVARAAGGGLDLGDQRHQVVAGQQAGADQQQRRRVLQQRAAQRGQRALHQAHQVGPVAAGAF